MKRTGELRYKLYPAVKMNVCFREHRTGWACHARPGESSSCRLVTAAADSQRCWTYANKMLKCEWCIVQLPPSITSSPTFLDREAWEPSTQRA